VATGSHFSVVTIQVPIKEAKNRFSELLQRVRDGERVIVTRHGQPDVEIVLAKPVRKVFDFAALEKWKQQRGYTEVVGRMADDFDLPLPEDFLTTPQGPEFWKEPKR
jgi:prevent-host-death family protein